MIQFLHEAVRLAYPNAVTITGDDYATVKAWDEAYEPIDLDQNIIEQNLPVATDEGLKNDCKSKAQMLLQQTDWVEIPSVSNTANNPHLMNVSDFLSYRTELRFLAVNPVEQPVWPTVPEENWSS